MELITNRKTKGPLATEGEMLVDGQFECYTLEPVDRGLTSDMPLADIKAKKVYGHTAIPTGRYKVLMEYWPSHQRDVPTLQSVPGFDGAGIHSGNTDKDTLGCILVGNTIANGDFIGDTWPARDTLYKKIIDELLNGQEVWITVQDAVLA